MFIRLPPALLTLTKRRGDDDEFRGCADSRSTKAARGTGRCMNGGDVSLLWVPQVFRPMIGRARVNRARGDEMRWAVLSSHNSSATATTFTMFFFSILLMWGIILSRVLSGPAKEGNKPIIERQPFDIGRVPSEM